jgi:hypothetical protein
MIFNLYTVKFILKSMKTIIKYCFIILDLNLKKINTIFYIILVNMLLLHQCK